MTTAHFVYLSLVILMIAQRISEMRKSRIHEYNLKMRGAEEYGSEHFKWMRLVHILWLSGCVIESFFVTKVSSSVIVFGAALFVIGQTLRWAAIETLGSRWTVRILVLPGERLIRSGVFRYIRHPNYLGVILELIGLPMIGGCFFTAFFSFFANLWILSIRIKQEDRVLQMSQPMRHEFQ